VGLLWRLEWDPPAPGGAVVESCRLHAMFAAFAELGVAAEPVVYADDRVDAVREQLLGLDGVLVWVNPIEHGLDRSVLDPLLRQVAAEGVWVSAHPDVIRRMATKEVLVDTGSMSWSAGTHLYRTLEQLRAELPGRLEAGSPLVLKQRRGMGGAGVWKVERADGAQVRVQHAGDGDGPFLEAFEAFIERCAPYFDGDGSVVEQSFQPRLAEGMVRVYLCRDEVVGFARQYPRGLLAAEVAAALPTEKVFEVPSARAYRRLREQMESEWVPELQRLVGVGRDALPVIWDADFLLGPVRAEADSYVLCEINASSTFSFPEFAMPTVARAALEQIARLRR
jgi:hypothetical protein